MIDTEQFDQLTVEVYESNAALGRAAARAFAEMTQETVQQRGQASVILATGNSQRTFIEALHEHPEIPWGSISVFHMDEYVGMSSTHPASFSSFMQAKVENAFHPRAFYGIQGDATDLQAELGRYTRLLIQHEPVVTVMGIGENGHLAFNDPPADFHTTDLIHIVNLDETCRRQQVGEGHFQSLDDVPLQALSLSVPALLKSQHVLTLVPEARKAQAVHNALLGPVSAMCPASILRTQLHARLFLDRDSASLLRRDNLGSY